ncbi:hypothetical protein CERSUDRAFT_35881, partial [Gelatoporia subvermispora B]
DSIYTRTTNPQNPARVDAIMQAVSIGPDLSEDQRAKVRSLIAEFADCFALAVSEVTPVKDAVHKLHIPEGATFSRKVHQRPLTPPQKEYLHKKIDELLAAGIIKHCDPSQVRCVSP